MNKLCSITTGPDHFVVFPIINAPPIHRLPKVENDLDDVGVADDVNYPDDVDNMDANNVDDTYVMDIEDDMDDVDMGDVDDVDNDDMDRSDLVHREV